LTQTKTALEIKTWLWFAKSTVITAQQENTQAVKMNNIVEQKHHNPVI